MNLFRWHIFYFSQLCFLKLNDVVIAAAMLQTISRCCNSNAEPYCSWKNSFLCRTTTSLTNIHFLTLERSLSDKKIRNDAIRNEPSFGRNPITQIGCLFWLVDMWLSSIWYLLQKGVRVRRYCRFYGWGVVPEPIGSENQVTRNEMPFRLPYELA